MVVPGSQVTYACSIRDMSEAGMKITLTNPINLPARFELILVTSNMAFPVSVRWQNSNEFGVEITGTARLVTPETSRCLYLAEPDVLA